MEQYEDGVLTLKQMPLEQKVKWLTGASGFLSAVAGLGAVTGAMWFEESSALFVALTACAVAGVGSAVFAYRTIASDLVTPFGVLSKIAIGLRRGGAAETAGLEHRGDEVGVLARAILDIKRGVDHYAEMQISLEGSRAKHDCELELLATKFEEDVARVVGTVASASSQLRQTASSMAEAAQQSTTQTGNVSNAMNSAAAGVTAAAAASDEFAMSINEISRQASSSAQLARKAGDTAREADDTISSLNDMANEIGQIVGLISSIAQRTNLLALNASIEAARGGEAGRGFAVVASEVKDLAAQTGKATERVSVQIQSIQQGTTASVAALQSIVRQVNELEATSVSIAAAVDQQSVAGQDLARSIDLAARSTENVSSTVTEVREASIATGAAASQVLSSSNELEQQATILQNQIGTFLQGVRQKAA